MFFQGGLGNQMFQYAAGRCIAEKRGVPLCLDASWYHYPVQRKFDLLRFKIDAPVVRSKLSFLSHMVFKTPGFGWRYSQVYRERPGRVDMAFFSLPDGCLLIGNFQSEAYFRDIAPVIRRDFAFDHVPIDSQSAKMLGRMRDNLSVAVHVRRRDYLALPQFHVCTEAYYQRALHYFRESMPGARFYVFSDDPGWCNGFFKDADCEVVDLDASKTNPLNDMRLIGSCRHAIVSNSSYAWWGAWLNNDAGQIVAAPDRWVNGPFDREDTPCPSWIRIPVDDRPNEKDSHG